VIVLLGAVALVVAPGVVVAAVLPVAYLTGSAAPAIVVIAAAAIGWVQFLAWFLHPTAGAVISAGTIAGTVIGILQLRARFPTDIGVPLLTFFLICLLYFCLGGERRP
jgi:hypothetical protein